ncbi:obscurin [Nephila pilipes]|uniref:Obscurin n=1 Tax=Nephila pilipes TaxID=299642 RepID=A0A8X6QSQ1_NEPPI|nr:obscurin [Nephila pilipes]
MDLSKKVKPEVFDVCEGHEVSASERYVFLFKGRVFVTEKRLTSDKESYHVTNLFRLQDVDLIDTVDGDPLKVVFKSHKKTRPGFPLSLRARSPEQKAAWLKELTTANQGMATDFYFPFTLCFSDNLNVGLYKIAFALFMIVELQNLMEGL